MHEKNTFISYDMHACMKIKPLAFLGKPSCRKKSVYNEVYKKKKKECVKFHPFFLNEDFP